MDAKRPTKKQRELLNFIDGFIQGNGYGPSYREIMRALDYKSVSTVAVHVDNLITRGWLRKRDYSARSLEVVKGAVAAVAEPAESKIKASESKWLVGQISARFKAAEADPAYAQQELDNLYVLVGALHVLGLSDAARGYKTRLKKLVAAD